MAGSFRPRFYCDATNHSRAKRWSRLRAAAAAAALPLLSGCNGITVLDPKGRIGADERSIIFLALGLMLVVVIPVIVMALAFAWRYRASNAKATYRPDWCHSGKIEAVVWLVPCVIVAALGWVTWASSHELDPYKPIGSASGAPPIVVDVVSLDWKWLFIYPELGIASVNEVAFPEGRPVEFHLTSGSVMNSFFIPSLGGQIYTMAGMETRLSLIANQPGSYDGLSANYSGSGFSDMKFEARALSDDGFRAWTRKVRASKAMLDADGYRQLAEPSEKSPVAYFSSVSEGLFNQILHKCFVGSRAGCTIADAKD